MTVDNEQTRTARTRVRRIIHLGPDEVEVTRVARKPSLTQSTIDDETACVGALTEAAQAGLLPGIPPESLGRALARASTDSPDKTLTRIRAGIVTNFTDTADVATIRTTLSPLTALPGEQPRGGAAGGRPGQVREPSEGHDTEATRLGLRVLAFDDTAHLRAWCADAFARSLSRAHKRGRPEEIAATGVRRPVSASMTLVQFADGTAPQWVPMLSDGISRLAVCAAGLMDQLDNDPAEAANVISNRLLPVAALTETSPAHELARKMRSNHQRFIREYHRHVDEHGPDEEGVRMQQFLTLPTDLHLLATDPATGATHPMEAAMETVVSDQHTGVDGWVQEDNSRHTALRALKRLLRDEDIDQATFDLCANRAHLATSPLLQTATGNDTTSTTQVDHDRLLLRRAVTVLAVLLGPSTYPPLKAALKRASGRKRLTMHQVVDYIAPLVCEPWGTLKPITRAWAYGGPAPIEVRDTRLLPVHPDDYLALVGTATDPDASTADVTAARLELALAGGTALIADGILTTALVGGSGSAPTPLAFRGPVSGAVEALTHTEEGLTSLAVAANHFRPSRGVRSARLPALDLTQPDKVARDGVGVPIRTTETVLAGYAAQAVAAQEQTEPEDLDVPVEPTPLENLQARAQHLPANTRVLLRDIELTKTLHDETGGPTALSEHDLDTVHDSLSRALKLVGRLT